MSQLHSPFAWQVLLVLLGQLVPTVQHGCPLPPQRMQ
jgi:hypothetical protein